MEKVIKYSLGEVKDYFYPVFRIIVGLMFFQHGAQKILGFLGGVGGQGSVGEIFSLFWWAGMIELAVGAALVLGIWVRLAALIGAIEMVVAYFMVHFPNGLYPILNGGELAVMFFVSFVVMISKGAKKWSLEKSIFEKELF